MKSLEERLGTVETKVDNMECRVDKLEKTDEVFEESLNKFAISLTEIGGRLKNIENIGKWFVGLSTSLLTTLLIAIIGYFFGGK